MGFFHVFIRFLLNYDSVKANFCMLIFRLDEHKEKIRVAFKGRFPPDKDLKMEVLNASRLFSNFY